MDFDNGSLSELAVSLLTFHYQTRQRLQWDEVFCSVSSAYIDPMWCCGHVTDCLHSAKFNWWLVSSLIGCLDGPVSYGFI